MIDKLMYIPDNYAQNYPFCRLQLVVEMCNKRNKPTNQISRKVPKVDYQRNKKRLI